MVVCWWDRHEIDDGVTPVTIPVGRKSQGYGTFCGLPCAIAYLDDQWDDRSRKLFRRLIHEYLPNNPIGLRARKAPHFTRLHDPINPLTIEEFRSTTEIYFSRLPDLMVIEAYSMNCICKTIRTKRASKSRRVKRYDHKKYNQYLFDMQRSMKTSLF